MGSRSDSGSKRKPPLERPETQGPQQGRRVYRSVTFYFIFLVALAAAIRLAYTLASRGSPFFDHLDLDTKFYDSWAKRIAAGDWVGNEAFFLQILQWLSCIESMQEQELSRASLGVRPRPTTLRPGIDARVIAQGPLAAPSYCKAASEPRRILARARTSSILLFAI